MTPNKCFKMHNLIKIGVLWVWKHVWGMVGRCMPNSGHGGPPGNRVMTIFAFYISAQIPNIDYFEVYGGLWAPGGLT